MWDRRSGSAQSLAGVSPVPCAELQLSVADSKRMESSAGQKLSDTNGAALSKRRLLVGLDLLCLLLGETRLSFSVL